MDCRQSKIIHEFELDLRLKGRSEMTIHYYCKHVRLFLKMTRKPACQVSEEDVQRYISLLYRSGYALNTIKLKIRSVKQFYQLLHQNGRVFLNPADRIREPTQRRRFPRTVLSRSEMDAIRNAIPQTCLVKLRDKAIVEVLYCTALRISELAALNILDVNLTEGLLSVRKGKGGGDRQAVLNDSAVKFLKKYLKIRRKIPDESESLWINYKGNRLSSQYIRIMIRKTAESAGVKNPSNPHAWRHGLATELLRRGASIRDVQVFLGHASIKTTQIYTHLTIRDLMEVHRRTHPREQDPFPAPDLYYQTEYQRHE